MVKHGTRIVWFEHKQPLRRIVSAAIAVVAFGTHEVGSPEDPCGAQIGAVNLWKEQQYEISQVLFLALVTLGLLSRR